MKKNSVIILLAVLLNACAAPTTVPSATVPETMTPSLTVPPSEVTATSIPDVALTATPTEAVSETPAVIVDSVPSELSFSYESPVMTENVLGKVPFSVEIATDDSLSPRIKCISINETFRNKDGQNSNEAWTTFVAMLMYKSSSFDGTFEQYIDALNVARQSNSPADWEKVASRIVKLNDMATSDYDPKPTMLLPMSDVDFSDAGYRSFDKVVFVYALTSSVDNITTFPDVSGNPGFGANLDGKTLYLYVGLSTDGAFGTVNQTTIQTASLGAWLRTGIVRGESKELQSILYSGNENGAITIVK